MHIGVAQSAAANQQPHRRGPAQAPARRLNFRDYRRGRRAETPEPDGKSEHCRYYKNFITADKPQRGVA
jgi:hypothetical protein